MLFLGSRSGFQMREPQIPKTGVPKMWFLPFLPFLLLIFLFLTWLRNNHLTDWRWPNEYDRKKISIMFMFVVLMIFLLIHFWSYSSIFRSCSKVKVHWYNLSVKFQHSRLSVWIFFSHLLRKLLHYLPKITLQSYWFDQNN